MRNYVRKTAVASSYVGEVGFYRVLPTLKGESVMWVPVKVVEAKEGYQRMDFLIEPVNGFGTLVASSKTVWFSDEHLNRCLFKPTSVT